MSRTAALLLALLTACPALAESSSPLPNVDALAPNGAGPTSQRPAPRRYSLDDLFARLEAAKDEAEAKGIAGLIEGRLARSGSDTADLLAERAQTALGARDAALAVELLDRVTQLRPGWAEAWSRRAAAFYLLDDPSSAEEDLARALAREPRLYNAWAALGHMKLAGGDKKHAVQAFRRALQLHPFLSDLREISERLTPEVDGRDL